MRSVEMLEDEHPVITLEVVKQDVNGTVIPVQVHAQFILVIKEILHAARNIECVGVLFLL